MPKKNPALRGLFLRGDLYYFQPSMSNGIRPPSVALQTPDLTEAICRAAEMREHPGLAPATGLKAEVQAHLRTLQHRNVYSRATVDGKRGTLKRFIEWLRPGTRQLQYLTTPLLQAYYNESVREVSVATAHKRLMDVRAFLNWAVEQRKIRRNPATGVREIDVPFAPRVKFCTRAMRDALIRNCDREDLKLVLMLGFHAGMRKNEIIQARPEWFDLDHKSIDMRDTPTMRFNSKKRGRRLPMADELYDFLVAYGLREPFLLQPKVRQGKNHYRYDFAKPFAKYMKEQGVEWVTPHVMRHTFASLLVQDGKSVYKVAQWMGDTVKMVEDTYGHLDVHDPDINLSRAA